MSDWHRVTLVTGGEIELYVQAEGYAEAASKAEDEAYFSSGDDWEAVKVKRVNIDELPEDFREELI